MPEGFRQCADYCETLLFPEPHRCLIRRDDEIVLHGPEAPRFCLFLGMPTHFRGNALVAGLFRHDVPAVADVGPQAGLVRLDVEPLQQSRQGVIEQRDIPQSPAEAGRDGRGIVGAEDLVIVAHGDKVADGISTHTRRASSSVISGEKGYVSPARNTGSIIRHVATQPLSSICRILIMYGCVKHNDKNQRRNLLYPLDRFVSLLDFIFSFYKINRTPFPKAFFLYFVD